MFRFLPVVLPLALLFAGCDALDFKPSGEPPLSGAPSPVSATVNLDTASDTLLLYGGTVTFTYTYIAKVGTVIGFDMAVDDHSIGSAAIGEPLEALVSLAPEGPGTLRIRARLRLGERSDYTFETVEAGSWPVIIETRPPRIEAFRVALEADSVRLRWQLEAAHVPATIRVWRDYQQVAALAPSLSTWVDTTYAGGDVRYTLYASSPNGTSQDTVWFAGEQMHLRGQYEPDAATLYWTPAPGTHPATFVVEQEMHPDYGDPDIGWKTVAQLDGTARSWPVPLRFGSATRYRVRAVFPPLPCAFPPCEPGSSASVEVVSFILGRPLYPASEYFFSHPTGTFLASEFNPASNYTQVVRLDASDLSRAITKAADAGGVVVSADGRLFTRPASGTRLEERDPLTLAVRTAHSFASLLGEALTPVAYDVGDSGRMAAFAGSSIYRSDFDEARLVRATIVTASGYEIAVSRDGQRLWFAGSVWEQAANGAFVERFTVPAALRSAVVPIEDLRYLLYTNTPALRVVDPLVGGQVLRQIETGAALRTPVVDPVTGYVGGVSGDHYLVVRLSDGAVLHRIPLHAERGCHFWLLNNTLLYTAGWLPIRAVYLPLR